MRFSALFLAGAASAAVIERQTLITPQVPDASDIKILGVTAIGTGCPAGHAFVNVDATGTIFDVAFDRYIVSAGPGTSPATDSRKNCRISINLQFPSGYQFSVIETRFTGYASLAQGQTGTVRAGYTFSGDPRQEVVFQKNLVAPYEDNYNMLAGVGVEAFSACGKTTAILNVNSEIRITPLATPYFGTMTVSAPQKLALKWRRCVPTSSA
ncbi:uncharacterized protein PODANS_3_480 [Podospora anserina S mat+]|uniref:Podospora anserina S mat+ genomic DNA chromosome 3, supercontig 1 n=5 Tax=Podospora TaxID=5144 RepID=B2ACB2_PODAN|nr:uncharacterized protein PODANS_3_480 [Podospora anserina S mat+]KAK4655222.1 hypothetical protein QC762_300480 [Podospora pseudocomata]KAK4666466.1 hypothetical protein QC763_300480 [Podospora pseudopauciseta]KAK4677630.1 hypothetical protein QC764_300480 [Podospora pseudoanserina]VBB76624.1 Putative protein of unknown function [Podospora comata]CAP61077.1 unnamed protein product [Podospora anserina S mat+]